MASPTLLNSTAAGFTTNLDPTIPAFNIVAGTDRVLLVHVSVEGSSSGVSVAPTSIKIDGIDLVQVVDGQTGGTSFRNSSSIWQLLEASFPANGEHNIEMIMPSATTTMNTVALYDSLAQATPSGSQVNSDALTNVTSVSADVTTTSNANHLVFSGSSSGVNATYNSYPAGFTLINDTSQDSQQGACAYSINTDVSTLQDVEYTRSASTNRLTASAVSYEGVGGGGGISIGVTEVKSNRIDISSLSISANLTITTTETRSSRVDLSTLSVAGNVLATVTEVKSPRVDNSSVTIDVSALSMLVTEIKGSRVDLSSIDIKKEIDLIVTEIKASRQDFSLLNIPVIITINPKNIIRVKRKENTVRIKRNSNIIRVK